MMAGDPLANLVPGDSLPTRQATWNGMLEAARDYRDRETGRDGGKPRDFTFLGSVVIDLLYSESASTVLDPFSVQTLGTPIRDPSDADLRQEAARRQGFTGATPAAATDQFAITLEPIQGQTLGKAIVAGLAIVQVSVSDSSHTRAVPVAATTANLASAASGGVPIVWKEAGTGTLWAIVLLGAAGDSGSSESPGSTLCDSRGWWWKVRDADTSFRAQVTRVTGACTCVDDTFDVTLTAAGTRSNFTNMTEFLNICGVDYAVALIPPGITVGGAIQYAPRLQLTEQGSSSPTVISISATCFGDGWAEFTGPGYDRYNVCTDTEETGCDGDNGFTIRVDCVCQSSNYNGPGWYVVANGSTAFTPSVAYNLQSPPACTVKLCPGGPYATEAAAYAATCFIAGPDSGASAETPIVSCLGTLIAPVDAEVEFYDGTGDATFLNGYVADISYPDSTGAGSLWGNTLSDIPDFMGGGSGGNINVFCAPDGSTPETFRLRLNNGAGSPGWGVDLTISTTPNQTSITGNGWDIEIVFANVPFYSPRDSVQTGTISAVLRRRSA